MEPSQEPTVKKSDPDVTWRNLALQFDEHRMQAIWHLQALLKDPVKHREQAEKFLKDRPLSGEKVLAERIKAIALAER